VGGIVGAFFLFFTAPLVSEIALSFSPRDYFLLTLMGLMLVGSLGNKSISKGLFSASAGLMLGVVGMDPISGLGRFTFGNVNLRGGISYIAVMIGLFGVGEALIQILNRNQPIVKQKVDSIRPPRDKLLKMLPLSLSSGVIGTIVGALPGAGGEIAALLAYEGAKRTVRKPEVPFGQGAYEGVVAPESANNAAVGGALIPMLTLGIPGDSVTAIFIGALAIHGIRAGPMLMSTSPGLFENLVFLLVLANVFLLVFGMMGVRLFAKLVEIPRNILLPLIIVISVIGSYSINNMTSDILVTLLFGVVGYFMKFYDVPVGPMVLGLILGPTIEVNYRRAILGAGSIVGMLKETVTNPVSLILLVILVLMVASQVLSARKPKAEEHIT
ncbi:MAG: tripartite tricarboxylate transporter permease, partial [Oscillospiraceae bacterium]|nr:tripartite tricarboxylate transporter permease [Oscillospiraceae bacterium]